MGGLVKAIAGPVLSIGGGLISGSKAADAAKGQAEALRAAADKASGMAQFTPYGMTTNFGSSTFDDGQGGYKLSPQLQAIQNQLFSQAGTYDPTRAGQAAEPIYGGASSLFNLAQQYLATSPEQAAADYTKQQQGLLAPGREQQLAALRNQQFQTGRTGLATGGTTAGGMQQTNPELAAYYNALAQSDRTIASQATQAGMDRAKFGAGLFGTGGELLSQVPKLTTAGYGPLEAQLGLLSTTEKMGQQPFMLSQDLADRYAQAGARQGQLYLDPQQAAATAYGKYQGYSPIGTAMSGAGSSFGSSGFTSGSTNNSGASMSSFFDSLFKSRGPERLA